MPTTQSIADLRRELAARERQVAKLRARRDKVARQLADLDRQIAALAGEAAPARKPERKKTARSAPATGCRHPFALETRRLLS